jgi:hypothetical protein
MSASMSKFQPGPWQIHDGGRFGEWGEFGPSVCAVTSNGLCQPLVECTGPADIEVCKATVQLIAAAPDLFHALSLIKRHIDNGVSNGPAFAHAYALAEAALTKAGVQSNGG